MRVEHEYERGGALQYLAAWDVGRARLFGAASRTPVPSRSTGSSSQVMSGEPYRSARRVFWVVDNGPSHRGRPSIERLQGAYPNLRLIHLPSTRSWLNQIEIYFSILERKVLTPPDAVSLDGLAARILAFQAAYEILARPFEWKFTRADLDRAPQAPRRQGRCRCRGSVNTSPNIRAAALRWRRQRIGGDLAVDTGRLEPNRGWCDARGRSCHLSRRAARPLG